MKNLYLFVLGEKRCLYYLARFEAIDRRYSGLNFSWNWAAFLSGVAWTLYRKMYGWFFMLLSVFIASSIFRSLGLTNAALTCLFIPSVAFGIFANALYHRQVQNKITTAQQEFRSVAKVQASLRKKGGVNQWAIWIFAWIPLAVMLVLIAMPAQTETLLRTHWDDYSQKLIEILGYKPEINFWKLLFTVWLPLSGFLGSITIHLSQNYLKQSSLFHVAYQPSVAETQLLAHLTTVTGVTPAVVIPVVDSKEMLLKTLQKTARDVNAQAPQMLNVETRLDKLEVAPDFKITQHFSFPHCASWEIKTDQIQMLLKDKAKKQVCGHILRYEANYVYAYNGNDGAEITRFEVKPSDCYLADVSDTMVAPMSLLSDTSPEFVGPPEQVPLKKVNSTKANPSKRALLPKKPCRYKGVMADEDYYACNLTPPTPRHL